MSAIVVPVVVVSHGGQWTPPTWLADVFAAIGAFAFVFFVGFFALAAWDRWRDR